MELEIEDYTTFLHILLTLVVCRFCLLLYKSVASITLTKNQSLPQIEFKTKVRERKREKIEDLDHTEIDGGLRPLNWVRRCDNGGTTVGFVLECGQA